VEYSDRMTSTRQANGDTTYRHPAMVILIDALDEVTDRKPLLSAQIVPVHTSF
jgi:hypothetical protein